MKFYMAITHIHCLCNSELFQIKGMEVREGQTSIGPACMGWQQNLWIHKKINYLENSRRTQVYWYSSPQQWEQIRVREQNAGFSPRFCISQKWCFQFSQVLSPSSAGLHTNLRTSIPLSMAAQFQLAPGLLEGQTEQPASAFKYHIHTLQWTNSSWLGLQSTRTHW